MVSGATVSNNSDAARYEVNLDGAPAGFAAYRLRDNRVIFTHTEVDSAFEGHGLGSALARGALDDVRERGLRAVPLCPFIAAYIERHPEYQDLVAG
ncbi:GNAT family N-acetyltransferase [Arthrobacter sp.]|uniref:GNAT family N-acetyltransferase n=1 Tax=Arthrobacter sp. TaxID=1667 RepID=UPI00281164AD|nr:GNAT family N-acetyltransferase [Arthrobacter sp.]